MSYLPSGEPPRLPKKQKAARRGVDRADLRGYLLWGGGLLLLVIIGFGVMRLVMGGAPDVEPTVVVEATVRPIDPGTKVIPGDTATHTPVVPTVRPTAVALDAIVLEQSMLGLINDDRRRNNLNELVWLSSAAQSARDHATMMVNHNFVSLLNLDGFTPSYRHTLAGGMLAVREHVYLERDTPSAQSQSDWQGRVQAAQQALLNDQAYLATLRDPSLTAVGMGLAYDDTQATFGVVQTFAAEYVTLQPVPRVMAERGQSVTLSGQLKGDAQQAQLDLLYQPNPTSFEPAALNLNPPLPELTLYASQALLVDEQGNFSQSASLDFNQQPGLYTLRVSIETVYGLVPSGEVIIRIP